MPEILATQEAEIRFKAAWENSSQDPISKIPNAKKSWQSGSSGIAPA
jgi:hypothetical protein